MNISRGSLRYAFVGLISAWLLAIPAVSHAAVGVSVRQVLPPSGSACPALGASDIVPFVYDGSLHSFDIIITDPAYVALGAKVGSTNVSFSQITRWQDSRGVRLHVDIPTYALSAETPVAISLIAPHVGSGGVTCLSTISTTIPAVKNTAPTPTVSDSAQAGVNTASVTTAPQYPWSRLHVSAPVIKDTQKPSVSVKATSSPYIVTATNSLGATCASGTGPSKLWIVLILLYAAFVWFLAGQRPAEIALVKEWNMALTIAAFLALLFFWYISAACRVGAWAPILATLIACAGLISLTRPTPAIQTALLLPHPQEN